MATEEAIESIMKDPFTTLLAALFGTPVSDEEKTNKEIKKDKNAIAAEDLMEKLAGLFDRIHKDVEEEPKETKYTVKSDDKFEEVHPEDLIEDETTSFSMSKEDLAKFVSSYTKLENTFRKLEHTYGIDLNANADSIYTQYNAIVWDLIALIFGEDNRDNIADFCFGDSSVETVSDLYEELV